MPTVTDVMRQYGGAYLEKYGARMPDEQKKVLRAMMACRTGELGHTYYYCDSCQRMHVMGRSCGNRHCPSCQQDKTRAWLEKQTDRLLPCAYFLITFTVPQTLRAVIRSHAKIGYAAMFEASSSALQTLAIRRFLQHVLPSGFQKVRHYGFFSPQSKLSLELVRWLVALHYDLVYLLLAAEEKHLEPRRVLCPDCGALMRPLRTVIRVGGEVRHTHYYHDTLARPP